MSIVTEMATEGKISPLPGFVHRDAWIEQQGKCAKTGKRWQDAGLIVVRYLGRVAYVDIEATAARLRDKDRRPKRERAA
jgi:hypothetical protein